MVISSRSISGNGSRMVETSRPLRVLGVNTTDYGGGAERVALDLVLAYRARGLTAHLAAGFRQTDLDCVLAIRNSQIWRRGLSRLARGLRNCSGNKRVHHVAEFIDQFMSRPASWVRRQLGHEDFSFGGTKRLLNLPPESPDILHIHNMHGNYFDLRALSELSHQVPTVLTLHDAWLLSGHCAHSMDCTRWRTGCGSCPDLTIPPHVIRDATAFNWNRKRAIYGKSRLYVATPSQWLMSKVTDSILKPAIVEARVVPNGVDTSIFRSGNRASARADLGIPMELKVILFASNRVKSNPWKDYTTLRAAIELLSNRLRPMALKFIALGEKAPAERAGDATIEFVPFQKEAETVARYYQSADIFVHAARADTFPNVVLESLSCGTTVVATSVGGIPEQIKGLDMGFTDAAGYGADDATGVLVPPRNPDAMAFALQRLLVEDSLRSQLSENAARDVRKRFTFSRQVDAYLEWYCQILNFAASAGPHQYRTLRAV
jgi:glycosyltransferase involved in cell wall biosynthesis